MQLELLPCHLVDGNESCTIYVNRFSIDHNCIEIWTLYYDGSKTQDETGVDFILMVP